MKKTIETVNKDGLKVKETVPKILLEILLYGDNSTKSTNDIIGASIQEELNKSRKNKHKARALWYIDNGELSVQKKKEWLIEHSLCKYYIMYDLSKNKSIEKDYVQNCLKKIKNVEVAIKSMKAYNINVCPKSNGISNEINENHIEDAILLEKPQNTKKLQ